jgi:hypothetical protein
LSFIQIVDEVSDVEFPAVPLTELDAAILSQAVAALREGAACRPVDWILDLFVLTCLWKKKKN